MKLPETIYTARVLGDYVYEWSKEDGLLRQRKQRGNGIAQIVSYVPTPEKVDDMIRKVHYRR